MTTRTSILLAAIVLAVATTGGSTVQANGLPFFKPADGGLVDLVYFGQIKDKQGMPLSNVELAVETTSRYMYEIQFDQDRAGPLSQPGHRRALQGGAAEGRAVDDHDHRAEVRIQGRHPPRAAARQQACCASTSRWSPATAPRWTPRPPASTAGPMSSDTFFLIGGLLAVGLIGAAAHRASRQPSIAG